LTSLSTCSSIVVVAASGQLSPSSSGRDAALLFSQRNEHPYSGLVISRPPVPFWLGIDNDTPSNLLTLNERLHVDVSGLTTADQSTPKMLLFQISDHVSDTNAKEA
ncbi:hypothetical protein KCU93_g437, partial [Aureobasidium melanogenum]